MAMTQKFTAEEVRREAAGLKAHGYVAGPAMLNAYAEELRAALAAQRQGEPDPMEAIVQHCMVTEAVSPDSADPYGTISRVIDWHQANTAPLAGVPDAKTEMDYEYDAEGMLDPYHSGHMDGWNDCRKARLAALAAQGQVQAVDAWMTEDGRVISDRQKATAIRDGGASASSVAPYTIPLTRTMLAAAPSAPEGDGGAE